MRAIFQRSRLWLALCAVTFAAFSIFTPPPANAAITSDVNVLDWNVCGNKCNNGNPVTAGDATLTAWHPAIFMAEEVCQSQLAHFANLNDGWDSNYVFFPKHTVACGTIGTAIFTHQPITAQSSVTIPVAVSSGAEDTVGCVRTTVGKKPNKVTTEACVTHLDNDPTDVTDGKQLNGTSSWQGAAAWAQDRANGFPLVFGGDFNLTPTSSQIAPLYNNIVQYGSTPTGQYFHELDQAANQPTHGSNKIDYIFYKHGYARNYAANAPVFTSGSDHAILYGQADLCDSSGCA